MLTIWEAHYCVVYNIGKMQPNSTWMKMDGSDWKNISSVTEDRLTFLYVDGVCTSISAK